MPQQLLELRDHQAREIAVGGACTSSRTATATATAPTPTPAPAPTGSLRGLCAIVALRTALLLVVAAFLRRREARRAACAAACCAAACATRCAARQLRFRLRPASMKKHRILFVPRHAGHLLPSSNANFAFVQVCERSGRSLSGMPFHFCSATACELQRDRQRTHILDVRFNASFGTLTSTSGAPGVACVADNCQQVGEHGQFSW